MPGPVWASWCSNYMYIYLLVESLQYPHVVSREDKAPEVTLGNDKLKLRFWLHLQLLPDLQDLLPGLEEHRLALVLGVRERKRFEQRK